MGNCKNCTCGSSSCTIGTQNPTKCRHGVDFDDCGSCVDEINDCQQELDDVNYHGLECEHGLPLESRCEDCGEPPAEPADEVDDDDFDEVDDDDQVIFTVACAEEGCSSRYTVSTHPAFCCVCGSSWIAVK